MSIPAIGNIFHHLPDAALGEVFEDLLRTAEVRIERIVSRGQSTKPGEWLDQSWGEWVILLQGVAALRIEGKEDLVQLEPGSYVHLPPHCRHRVEWTAAHADTIWLAIHYDGRGAS